MSRWLANAHDCDSGLAPVSCSGTVRRADILLVPNVATSDWYLFIPI